MFPEETGDTFPEVTAGFPGSTLFEIRRGGEVVGKAKGMLTTKMKRVTFKPGTDVRIGDELFNTASEMTYPVTDVDRRTMGNKVFTVDAS